MGETGLLNGPSLIRVAFADSVFSPFLRSGEGEMYPRKGACLDAGSSENDFVFAISGMGTEDVSDGMR